MHWRIHLVSFFYTFIKLYDFKCLDKFGIQFNKDGGLDALLDAATQTKFNEVTTCLTVQYNKICPLTQGAFAPNCLDGVQTLNENIADNAG